MLHRLESLRGTDPLPLSVAFTRIGIITRLTKLASLISSSVHVQQYLYSRGIRLHAMFYNHFSHTFYFPLNHTAVQRMLRSKDRGWLAMTL